MKITKLSDAYLFPGFRPLTYVTEVPDKLNTVIVTLRRTSKKNGQNVLSAVQLKHTGMTRRPNEYGISPVATCGFILSLKSSVSTVECVI